MKKNNKKLVSFALITMTILFFEAILIGIIDDLFPSTIYLFGNAVPFGLSYFILGMTLMTITLLLMLMFPKTDKKLKRRRKT